MGILDRAKPLGDVPRFGGLSGSEMKQVVAAGREVSVPENWSMIWESTTPDKAYLVIEGRLRVTHHGKEVAELSRGDLVGEMGIANHKLRSGTVTALTPLTMLHFTAEQFRGLYDKIPAFRKAVDTTIAERMREVGLSTPNDD